ncbi:MAG: hypothetical protein KDK36_00490 [Leptospiraceae bacterium]|nr:hypothetical protein [Leptospiraceae bacterium]
MEINGKYIEFYDLKDVRNFINENDLFGIAQLETPIMDNGGSILIKEHVNIKESALRKLETLDGQYEKKFQVRLNSELLEKLKQKLFADILPKIEKSKFKFISYLYNNYPPDGVNYKNVIQNCFYKKELVIYLYFLKINNHDFFNYISETALLVLAIVALKSYQFRFLNRYAFLSGLFSDICLSETDNWKYSYESEMDMDLVAKTSSQIALRFHLPEEIYIPIQSQRIQGIFSEGTSKPVEADILANHPLLNSTIDSSDKDEEGENKQEVIEIITNALKIAKFLIEVNKKIEDDEESSQKLIMMLTYSTEKGLFSGEIANPVIDSFKQYERLVGRTRKIAEMESKCLYKPSAWAYPKPNATQILCRDRVFNCPHFLSGWDINIVTTQTAYGYVGVSLSPGSYPKCKLERELESLNSEEEI